MKKVSAIIVCCLLVMALIAMPVLAATPATFTVAASKTEVVPGETITVTVSTTKLENCSETGISVLFDEAFLEYVSGTCKTPGGMMVGVNKLAGKANCYYKGTNAITIEGVMYELQFKVKDAAVGSTKITTDKAQAGSEYEVTANTVTIKVKCEHTFGNWENADATNHKRTCTKCGEEELVAHKWDAGKVTAEPSCNATGEKTFTCETCGATKKDTVPATGAHNYATYQKVDATNHKILCGCGEAKTEAHKWDAGTVTTEPDCKNDGVKTFTCACGETKTEAIPSTGAHNYGAWEIVDAENHKRTCTGCGEAQTEAHKAGTELFCDAESHWFECVCGQKMSVTAHAYEYLVGDAEGHIEGCLCTTAKPGATKVPHTFDEGKVTKPATQKAEGEKTFTCTGCGFEKIEKIEKLPATPGTGDNTQLIPMIILAVLSACGLAVTVVARKRAAR